MMNMSDPKFKKIISTVIVVVLVLAMIVPMAVSYTHLASASIPSVIPVSWVIYAPRLRPGFTNVTYLWEMTPSTTFKAAISVIFSCFGSSPVVSRSRAMYEFVIVLHFLLFFAARAIFP